MTKRIAMWSGPRNLSTAMMRSWENRPDTEVMDEPLYAWYLATTGLDHPGADRIIDVGPSLLDDAIGACLAAPLTSEISYQKHMAGHLLPEVERTWLDELVNCLLLRDPRRVLDSYTKVRDCVTLSDIGLPQQVEIARRCEIVIDSADFLTDPDRYSRLVCEAVGVEFDPAMLAWPAGRRDSDGVWAEHWYASVEASTGFGPPLTSPPPTVAPHLADLVDEAMDLYRDLHRQRATV